MVFAFVSFFVSVSYCIFPIVCCVSSICFICFCLFVCLFVCSDDDDYSCGDDVTYMKEVTGEV